MRHTKRVYTKQNNVKHIIKKVVSHDFSPLFPSLTLRLKVDVAHGMHATFLEHLRAFIGAIPHPTMTF